MLSLVIHTNVIMLSCRFLLMAENHSSPVTMLSEDTKTDKSDASKASVKHFFNTSAILGLPDQLINTFLMIAILTQRSSLFIPYK